MRTTLRNALLVGLMAASMGACAPTANSSSDTTSQNAPKTSALADPSSLDGYVAASFDDIYNHTYNGYSVMYQGIPVDYDVTLSAGENPRLSIMFMDDPGSRLFFAYCYDAGCYFVTALNISQPLIEMAIRDKLPIRVYGNQDGKNMQIRTLSFLTGPNSWETLEVDDLGSKIYTPPQPAGGQ